MLGRHYLHTCGDYTMSSSLSSGLHWWQFANCNFNWNLQLELHCTHTTHTAHTHQPL